MSTRKPAACGASQGYFIGCRTMAGSAVATRDVGHRRRSPAWELALPSLSVCCVIKTPGFSHTPTLPATPHNAGVSTRAGSPRCSPQWTATTTGLPTLRPTWPTPQCPSGWSATPSSVSERSMRSCSTTRVDSIWTINVRASLLLSRPSPSSTGPIRTADGLCSSPLASSEDRCRRRSPTPRPRRTAPDHRDPGRTRRILHNPPHARWPVNTQLRRPTSSRCCSHRMPRPSPARSSTPRADFGASHLTRSQTPSDFRGKERAADR